MNQRNNYVAGASGRQISRRTLLGKASQVAAFSVLPRYVLGGTGYTPPSEKLNVAVIGAGGQGLINIKTLLDMADVQVMAVCDVAEETDYSKFYYGGTAGRGPAVKTIDGHYANQESTKDYGSCASYLDFRKMFEKEKSIDAVLVATPDHNHAIATMAAIRNGKGVYCEKPLAHSVYETRMVTTAAREAKAATQLGNHGHSNEGIRLTCEWIWDGAIGEIREVHAWAGGGGDLNCRTEMPAETPPLPAGLDWDLWLGPAQKRPYHPLYHPFSWRWWWAFGEGTIGDMACHNLDPAVMALKLKHPQSVEAFGNRLSEQTTPEAAIYYYHFGPRGDMPPVKVIWYSGGLMPPRPEELEEDRKLGGNGILFVGDKGKILCPGWAGNPRIIPESKMKEYKQPAKTLPRSKGHHRDWVDACKGGAPPSANFDYSGPLSEIVLLGNVALRAKKRIYWDGANMKVTNAPEADEFIRPEYHNGWTL